jgi:cephalosporin-C deacetylase-like acetyl esterase
MRWKSFCLALLVSACPLAYAQNDRVESVGKLLAYNQKLPLDIKEESSSVNDGVTIHDITYASPKGGRATAYLVVPSGNGPHAGIVFGHWANGDRTEFLSESIAFARAGAVSVLIDYPWKRATPWWQPMPGVNEPEKRVDLFVQTLIDLKRAIDLLSERPDVDPKRIGYIGHSFGAQWGAILSAVDKRLKTAVLVAGVPTASSAYLESTGDPELVEYRRRLPKGQLEKFVELYGQLDAIGFVPFSHPVSLLFQFPLRERIVSKDQMLAYAQAASSPKAVKFYDAGHELLDPQAMLDRANWVQERLQLRPITAMKGK